MTDHDATSTDQSTDSTDAVPSADGPIVAHAGRYYRNARFIMAGMCLAMAGWFGYDGWVKYPAQQREYRDAVGRGEKPSTPDRSDLDINIQRLLGVSLPVVAIGIVAWLLYRSRGCYRLENEVLTIPGHPPIPLDAISAIDKSKWDKKGILYVNYSVDGAEGTATLDDFVYQQEPTDQIVKIIEARVNPPVTESESVAEEESTPDSAA